MHCCYVDWVLCLQMPRSSLLYKAGNLKRFAKAGMGNNPNLTTPTPSIAGKSATPLLQPDNRDDDTH